MKLVNNKTMLMHSIATAEATIQTTTEAIKTQGAEVDTHLLEEVTEDLKITIPTTIETPPPPILKAEAHTGEIVVTKTKITEEAKTIAKTMATIMETKPRTSANIAEHQATL
jgi:hypothetical protein